MSLIAFVLLSLARARSRQTYGSANHVLPLCKTWPKARMGDWHVLLPCEGCLVERNDSTPRACGLDVRGGLDAVPSALAVMTAWFREEGLSEAKWPPADSIGGPLQIAPSSSVVGTCAPDQSMLMQQPNGAFLTSLSRRLHESPYKLSPSLPRETPSGLAAGSPPYSGSRTSHPCLNQFHFLNQVICVRKYRIELKVSATEQRDEIASVHSITSSASARSFAGMSRRSAFAVLRLMTNSNLVGCTTGRSAGFSPLKIRPT